MDIGEYLGILDIANITTRDAKGAQPVASPPPNGLLTMQMLGGWLDQALPDQRWVIIGSKGPVKAVTGIRDIYVVPADERTRVFPRDSLYLDVGARSEAEVRELGIESGLPIMPDAPFES